MTMMQFDRISLGRQAKELGFVRDTSCFIQPLHWKQCRRLYSVSVGCG